jgi:hypothetical protein
VTIHTSCNESWSDRVLVMSNHVEDRVGENKSSDQFVFSGIVKVQKLIICGDAIYFRLLANNNANNTVDDDSTKLNILNRLVSFLFEQDNIFLVILEQPNRLGVSQSEYFFGREV